MLSTPQTRKVVSFSDSLVHTHRALDMQNKYNAKNAHNPQDAKLISKEGGHLETVKEGNNISPFGLAKLLQVTKKP